MRHGHEVFSCLSRPGASDGSITDQGYHSDRIRRWEQSGFAYAKIIVAALWCSGAALAQTTTTVFSDNFATSQGTTFTTSGTIGTSDWSVTRSGDDWGARIDNGILELTNTASAATRAVGWVYTSDRKSVV